MMKRTEKLFVSMASIGILLNNVAYATTEVVDESEDGLPTKYIFMGVAALVIILLLFLGYKMDTKGESGATSKVSHKAQKTKQKLSAKAETIKENSGAYEADEEVYEDDGEIFDNDDLNDSIEYKEDDENSLYSTSEDAIDESEEYSEYEESADFNTNESTVEEFSSEPVENYVEPSVEEIVESEEEPKKEIEEPEEELGEEFDTSIIDGLDDEDDTKSSFDETMLFNNSDFSATGSSLEDEIDSLDNVDDNSDIELISDNNDDDKFIEELKNFEEPESSFQGFSVAPKTEKKVDNLENVKSSKYTRVKKEETPVDPEPVVEETPISSAFNNDFLSQMEENLQKNKAERTAKKTTKKSTTKKED